MRILHVTTEYPPVIYGGLGTAVAGLVKASARAGLDIAVLLVGAGSMPAYESGQRQGRQRSSANTRRGRILIQGISYSTAAADAVEFVKQWLPDIVHVHVFWLAHVAAAIREQTGVRLVYTVHSLDRAEYELGQGPPECLTQWLIQSDLIAIADRVVALTADEAELIAEYCPRARGRVRVVGNGIDDTPLARKSARKRHPAETATILYTGRFVDRKGIRELLEASPKILEHAPGARLVMAGGHRHSSAEEMAARWLPQSCRPFRDRIDFTGWLTPQQLTQRYANADILVVPSWYEPFGMVILEGMLFGLAIVASDVGGPKEILVNGYTGLFCIPRDSASIERRVLQLIDDPGLRVRLGRNASQQVRSRWLYRNVIDQMRSIYGEIAGTRALPARADGDGRPRMAQCDAQI